MKLWQKKEAESSDSNSFEQFCIGRDPELDLVMAEADLRGSLAHARMLSEQNLLQPGEYEMLEKAIYDLLSQVKDGTFVIEPGIEDIHSQVEYMLTGVCGDAGKKIHSGRSRNDQSLLDIKLYLRTEISDIADQIKTLFDSLMELSEKHKSAAMPGYTHFQVAMPSTFGLWFSAYAESLSEDLVLFQSALTLCDKNPLGSGAGYGSSFPLNRSRSTELLGMSAMHVNSINAQLARGKTEKWMAVAMANSASTLSRLAYDICLYNSQNFGFVRLSDKVSTGSSIMPHKRNPDVFELLRAHFNRLQSLPNELTLLCNNLPTGYHRDMQLSKEILFPAIERFRSCLEVFEAALSEIEINVDCLSDKKYDAIYTVERVAELVMQGQPFRDAYKQVGLEFEAGVEQRKGEAAYSHEGSIGNLRLDLIQEQFNLIYGELKSRAGKR